MTRRFAELSEYEGTVVIYGLRDPLTGEMQYIGKATNLRTRFCAHLNEKGDTRKCRWIAKLLASGTLPRVEILEREPVDWQDSESRWIAHFRSLGADICNHTSGGEGLHNPTQETRDKIGALRREEWAKNREKYLAIARSPQRCQRLSTSLTGRSSPWSANLPQNQAGRKLSDDARASISKALLGNQYALGSKHSPETCARQSVRLKGNTHTKGRVMPEHEKKARSASNMGVKRTPETCLKQREAALRRWANTSLEDRRLHMLPAKLGQKSTKEI